MSKPTYDLHIRFTFEDISMIDKIHATSPHNKSEVIRMLVRAGVAARYPRVFTECTGIEVAQAIVNNAISNEPLTQSPEINIRLGLTEEESKEIKKEESKGFTIEDILRLQNEKPEDRSV